jgi:hypothetical protein
MTDKRHYKMLEAYARLNRELDCLRDAIGIDVHRRYLSRKGSLLTEIYDCEWNHEVWYQLRRTALLWLAGAFRFLNAEDKQDVVDEMVSRIRNHGRKGRRK